MAKKKAAATENESSPRSPKGFTDHHKEMERLGSTLVGDSRPRGKPYRFEEWLTSDRRYNVVKVYDDGKMVKYTENAQFDDPTAATQNMR